MVRISLVPTLVLMVFYVSTFRRMCAVPNMAVFCSSRTSWLPGMLPTYFLNDFEMVPVAPIITGITVVFTFHIRWISIVRSLYFKIFQLFFFYYITIFWDGNIYQYACPLFIISDYNIWLIVTNYYYYYYYSVRCASAANAIAGDTDIFNGRWVSVLLS